MKPFLKFLAAKKEIESMEIPFDQRVTQDGNTLYEYISLPATLKTILPVLRNHELILLQSTKGRAVVTEFLYMPINNVKDVEVAYRVKTTIPKELRMPTIHLFGGAISYAKRIALHTVLGIIGESNNNIENVTEQSNKVPVTPQQKTRLKERAKKGTLPIENLNALALSDAEKKEILGLMPTK